MLDPELKEEFVKISERFDKLENRLDDLEDHVGTIIQSLADHIDKKLEKLASDNNLIMVHEPKFEYKPRK